MKLEDQLTKAKNSRFSNFSLAKSSVIDTGFSQKYFYNSKAVEEAWKRFESMDLPIYHQEYVPNPFHFQYDLEIYIFIHFADLYKRELELEKNPDKINLLRFTKSATLLNRETHLSHAASIRWPGKLAPDGSFIGDLAITPWLVDYYYAVSNYKNVIEFGGAGQGKTYGPLSFMSMIYDYFIFTKKGAQCTFSTVSESKIKGSTWPYAMRLYEVNKDRYQFSLVAGKARKCGDYTYNRVKDGKVFEQGGTFKGVLIPRGRKDSSVVDKLTGYHDPEARIYLLDEMQSTDDAPLGAYNNMFLHPKYGWFNASGNFDEDTDLLGINVAPNTGWDSVNQETHMWESTLKTRSESLGHNSLVIHFNNDLSLGVANPEFARKFHRFVPTQKKKNELYPNEATRNTIAYKRFWIGFRFEKSSEKKIFILTKDILEDTKSYEKPPEDYLKKFTIGSFDSAPASVDRNISTAFDIGTTYDGLPMVNINPGYISLFEKPTRALEYYRQSCDNIITFHERFGIEPGHYIMDWTARPAHIEMLATRGYPCHHLIYQEKVPDKPKINEITGQLEDRIPLQTIATYVKAEIQRQVVHYADQAVTNKITLGAYIFRMFVEAGRVRGINSSLLTGLNCESFDKEFLTRKFIQVKRKGDAELLNLDSKEDFKKEHNFSPDILDTFFQAFYMLYVVYNVRPNIAGLGKLEKKKKKRSVDNYSKLWQGKRLVKI